MCEKGLTLHHLDMKRLITTVVFLSILLSLKAQKGNIAGRVTNENGEAVPAVMVFLVDEKGVASGKGAKTDASGNYNLGPFAPGIYNVRFTQVRYFEQTQKGVVVNADYTTYLDIKLMPLPKEESKADFGQKVKSDSGEHRHKWNYGKIKKSAP
jgi:hypothetical protein